MAFSSLGTAVGDTVISGAECVAKTYPEFWDVFKNLGGKVEIDGQ
jgi:5-enolpyruvylshikimate-3-phosphate synthase